MTEAVSAAEWQHLLRAVLGVDQNDAAAAATAAGVARGAALVATAGPGALFDAEPSHHARALDTGVRR